jgi:zinc finger protein 830
MADVRALLAAERQARRISHPYLTYTKSGQLLCNVCQLNVKSETLWEGHLKSANHRKNAKAAQDASSKNLKRKLDDVEEAEDDGLQIEAEGRKKPKSRAVSLVEKVASVNGPVAAPTADEDETAFGQSERQRVVVAEAVAPQDPEPEPPSNKPVPPDPNPAVDEDEWAAFEREVAPLAQADHAAATITAAPVSAEQLEKQKEENRWKQQENEAEAEKEEEERRAEEEVEIMEDLEERVKKWKEKREALRIAGKVGVDTGQVTAAVAVDEVKGSKDGREDDESDDDDVDDWYS